MVPGRGWLVQHNIMDGNMAVYIFLERSAPIVTMTGIQSHRLLTFRSGVRWRFPKRAR